MAKKKILPPTYFLVSIIITGLIHFILPTNLVWIAFPGIVVAIIAEITFCVWLLLKNVKTHEINTSDI